MNAGHLPALGTELRALLGLAWPLALTNLAQFALTVTDALFLGRVGTEALAASTLGANLYWALIAPGVGLALAASATTAQTRGRGVRYVSGLRGDVRAALWAALAAILPCWAVLWNAGAILRALGQEAALASLAEDYVRALMWGGLPWCGFVVLRGFLAAEQRPLAALWVSGLGVALNVPLNAWLIFGGLGVPPLGVVGAGVASSLCNVAMCAGLVAVIAADRRLGRYRVLSRLGRPDAAKVREVASVGLPIAGSMTVEIGVFAVAALAMGWFGAAALAAHTIALQVAAMTFMVPMGIGMAVTARVGLFAGAGDPRAAERAGWIGLALAAGFMAGCTVPLLLAGEAIAWAFLDAGAADAAAVAALAATLLVVAGLFQLADGVQAVAGAALRGLKDTRVPMLLSTFGYWAVGLPGGLLLAHVAGLGPLGLWIGLAAALFLVAGLMTRRWARRAAEGVA